MRVVTDSACKNQLVMVSVQYCPFNTYIPIRSTTIGESRVARDPITMHTSWRSNSDITSVTRVSMTFRVVRTNQYNQDLGLIHSTIGNHLESPNEGSSIDHQVTIHLYAQKITMFPTNETCCIEQRTKFNTESGENYGSLIGRMKKVDKTQRTWTAREEVLIIALKNVIKKGWKSENGFKAAYLTLLENAIHASIPGSNLRGNPHINSRVHVWKKTYSKLVMILGKSFVWWNDTDNNIEATDETWETIIKVNMTYNTISFMLSFIIRCCNLRWTLASIACDTTMYHYHDWCEIFENYSATGEHSQTFQNALNDVLKLHDDVPNQMLFGDAYASATSKKRKRKQANEVDESIVAAINNLADITKVTMNALVKQLTASEKKSDAQDVVFDALQGMIELSKDEHVISAQLLFNNHNKLALFKCLNDKGKLSLVVTSW
ncbi:hypothetical protein F511_32153 [Dorcoceras hygrometricum]|uniref:Myb/SANT-like domain-containing protein n=1 Tax=Dorcoceras hygrometricum TaxID=472368 RepID=A0A2Z7D013_9LAMI|nr:hypothetical protein F511_32153 [Dorcoceras hygrometricum]